MLDVPTMIKYGGPALAVLGTFYGGATFTHDKLQQIDQIEQSVVLIDLRLESKILNDRYSALQSRLWKISDRYGEDLFEAPGSVKEEYREIKAEMEALDREINAVQQDYKRRGSSNQYYDRKMEKQSQ